MEICKHIYDVFKDGVDDLNDQLKTASSNQAIHLTQTENKTRNDRNDS